MVCNFKAIVGSSYINGEDKARECLNFLHNRFPARSEIITILGIVVFVCHSWSLLGFFKRLSSFQLYLELADIAGIFAFMMAFAFLESLVITGVLVLLSALLPSIWLRDGFAFKGFIVIGMGTASAILLQRTMQGIFPSLLVLTLIWLTPFVWTVLFIILAQRKPRLQSILLEIAERISIMLFIYVPVGLISLILVTFEYLL